MNSQRETVAPGMSQVVMAGEHYTITDNEGAELELVGRDDPLTLSFINAFDSYVLTDRTLPAGSNPVRDAAWQAVMDSYESLPRRIKEQMPSHKTGGIILPGRTYDGV